MYSIGRGCNGEGYTFLQNGYNVGIYLIWGMNAELLLQIWENLVGILQSSIPPVQVCRGFTSFGDVCGAPSADLGKSRRDFAIMNPY